MKGRSKNSSETDLKVKRFSCKSTSIKQYDNTLVNKKSNLDFEPKISHSFCDISYYSFCMISSFWLSHFPHFHQRSKGDTSLWHLRDFVHLRHL
ncbi:hypothetical protein Hanom_Chr16g01437971 [Helianthus anomalus]